MIMRKVFINDKEMYETVTKEEALLGMMNNEKFIFTDETEEDELREILCEEKMKEEIDETINLEKDDCDCESNNQESNDSKDSQDSSKDDNFFKRSYEWTVNLGKDIGNVTSDIYKRINKAFKKSKTVFYSEDDSKDPNSKTSKLLKILPFMNEEDIHEIVISMIENDDVLQNINISAFLPFLTTEDCNTLFIKAVESGNTNFDPVTIAPFVSSEALTIVVDMYLEGKIKKINIDSLYPFLSNNDIKRLFKKIMESED